MQDVSFTIKGEYIELIKLLKALDIADSGSEAKAMVDGWKVSLNGQIEYRKRAKVKPSDLVTVWIHKIIIANS